MTANPQDYDRAELRERVGRAHRTAMTLLLALTASIVLYAVIGLIILNVREPAARPLQARIPFFVGALFLALGSIALRRTQLRWIRLEVVGGLRGPEGLIKHFSTTALIAGALAEAIGVMALVIVFFGGSSRDVVTLSVVSLLVILASYPRRSAWEKAVEYFASNAPGAPAK